MGNDGNSVDCGGILSTNWTRVKRAAPLLSETNRKTIHRAQDEPLATGDFIRRHVNSTSAQSRIGSPTVLTDTTRSAGTRAWIDWWSTNVDSNGAGHDHVGREGRHARRGEPARPRPNHRFDTL
jgi:hypothetical protein